MFMSVGPWHVGQITCRGGVGSRPDMMEVVQDWAGQWHGKG